MPINRAPFNALVDDSGNGLTGSIWNKAAIQSVLLDPIDAELGAWIAYTPTWTTTAVAPGIGNGQVTGRYRLAGKTCHVRIRLAFGTTTTPGTGAFILSLPVAFYAALPMCPLIAYLQDASVGAYMGVAAQYGANQLAIYGVGAPNGVNSGAPFTWTTSDYIEINGAYEIA